MNAHLEIGMSALRSMLPHHPASIRIMFVFVVAVLASLPIGGHAATLQAIVLAPTTEGSGNASLAVELAFDVSENPANCQINGTVTTTDAAATSPQGT